MLWLLFLSLVIGCVGSECPGEDLSLAPRPYTKPENLPVCRLPYRGPNCTCPSSLFECACHKFGRCKVKPGCIPMSWINDFENDCGDWSDEFSDICPKGSFMCDCFNTTCKGETGCFPKSVKCNEKAECPDRSDEGNCPCPFNEFECSCRKAKNCTLSVSGCVSTSYQCDWFNDCGDWSDEVNCTCPADTFQCDCFKTHNCTFLLLACLPKPMQCDRQNDCGDWSDEVNCTCTADKFQCDCLKTNNCTSLYGGCPDKALQCDGINDCGDWSDEVNCTCPAGTFECPCYKTLNCMSSLSGCLSTFRQCDGINDCEDGSDEVDCTCPAGTFQCDCYKTHNCTSLHGECVETILQCDGENHCGDWSDEVNCTCAVDEFECACYKTQSCTSLLGCISRSWQCDGMNDCGDWSDEVNCTCPAGTFECPCYKTLNCTSSIGGWLFEFQQCDGQNDCGDWGDEVNCTCPADKFKCGCYKTHNCASTNGVCLDKVRQCNGENDCDDGSDEVNCTCPADKFTCACVEANKCSRIEESCINRSKLCDGTPDCYDESDESQHICNCSGVYARCPCDPGNKHCPPHGRCIPFEWIGDKVKDCSDGSDELCLFSNITQKSYAIYSTTCKSENLARYLVHSSLPLKCNRVVQPLCADDINSCEIEKVICFTAECKIPEENCRILFFCENQQLLPYTYFCDGLSNFDTGCSDRSDEVNEGFGFKCSGPTRQGVCVLPQINVYDSMAQCSDGSDLCFVKGQFRCFQCLDKQLIISPKQVCDGVVDCFDMSDECLCSNQSLCDKIRGNCPPNQMHCNGSVCLDQNGILCNSSVKCVDHINLEYCSVQNKTASTYDKLAATFDEKGWGDALFVPDLVYSLKEIVLRFCDGQVNDAVRLFGEANCLNMYYCYSTDGINIKNSQVCDGKVDCHDSSDEFLELCQNTRYYCTSNERLSIDKSHVCDGNIDCDNESDESRCRCGKERFYCTNKQPLSVEWKLVQNGIHDCSDGSDECVNLAGDAFADVNEMIANSLYRAIFWITAILALGGNSFVFVATAHSLYNANRDQNVFINTGIFILNLSFSDFLMGIYLLAIVVQGTRFSGSYCLFDKKWRSSSLCSGLGVLVILSSEASAFTMTAMTTFRLISAFKPFTIRAVGVSRIIFAELFCWISSIILATIPLFEITSGYFVTDVWFPNNFFGSDFVSRENMSLLSERITGAKPDNWNAVKQTIVKAFPRYAIQGEFGYYGETSVCMPRLFATRSEFAWEYSTFLITINFIMFIYMVIAYGLIYKQSNHMKGSRSTDVSSKMQKRITRLILTDFCCWIPICVMGYLSVGGIKMPPDAYVLSACLLLPINSALNPLLYSKVVEGQLSKAKNWLNAKFSLLWEYIVRSSDLAVRYNAGADEEGNEVIEFIG